MKVVAYCLLLLALFAKCSRSYRRPLGRFSHSSRRSRLRKATTTGTTHSLKPTSSSGSDSASATSRAAREGSDVDEDGKRLALELLDCLTCPKDPSDPQYDIEKDYRRDNLLATNDYNQLKVELRSRGLRTSGDKPEMIMRLLLSIIDPSVNFNEVSGVGANLQYISEEDVKSEKVTVVPSAKREPSGSGMTGGPDAEDLAVLRRRRRISNSPKNSVGGSAMVVGDEQRLVMDGMTRSEIDLPTQNIVRVEAAARSEDIIESSDLLFSTGSSASRTSSLQRVAIKAYVVGGKDVLKTWVKNSAAIVLLPDEEGWKSKKIRVLADEISFYNQAIVVVPDVYRGLSFNRTFYEEGKFFNGTTEGDQTEITAQSSASLLQSSVDKSSTVKDSLDSWQSSQSSRRILDDVVATMKHIYDSFDVKSISLAGVGYGGGRALEIACDLSDIASYAQWREMLELQSYAEYQLNRSNPNMNTMENRKELDTFQKEFGMTYQIASKVLEKFDNVLRARTAAAVLSNRTLVLMGEENQEPKPQYQSMLEEILEDENNDNTTMTTSNRLNNINNQSSEIITTPVADINDQIELPSDGIDYLTALSDDAIKELTMEEIMERAFQSGNVISSSEASRGSTKTVSEFTEDNTLTQVIRTMSEEERLIAEIKSLQQAAHRAKNKNLIVEYPSITPVDIAKKFVPRSILALSPTNYNVQSVGSSIRIPSFFAFGDHATNQQGARIEDAKELQRLLLDRVNDIFDFSIRVYQGQPDRFVHSPMTEKETQCAQETLTLGSLWLDAYSTLNPSDFTDGAGGTKFTPEAFVVISQEQVQLPIRSSPIATHLHDNPSFFRKET